MKYQPGDRVIFSWNYEIFSGVIVKFVRKTMDNIYLVHFPNGSYAGSHTNPREISECFLLRDSEIKNKEVKRINIII
jgi:hypothetical protein